MDGIRLADDAVRHLVAAVNVAPFVSHVLRLGRLGVVGAVLLDIITHAAEEIGPVARLLQVGAQSVKIAAMVGYVLAEKTEIVLFDGR